MTTFNVGDRVTANRDITTKMLNTYYMDDTVRVDKGTSGTVTGESYVNGFDLTVRFGDRVKWCVMADWLDAVPPAAPAPDPLALVVARLDAERPRRSEFIDGYVDGYEAAEAIVRELAGDGTTTETTDGKGEAR